MLVNSCAAIGALGGQKDSQTGKSMAAARGGAAQRMGLESLSPSWTRRSLVSKVSVRFLLALALFGLGSSTLSIDPARAQSAGVFDGLAGSWTGEGSIRENSGATERMRCVATYDVAGGGDTLNQNLKCASDSYKFELHTQLQNQGGSIVGNWSETTRNVEGGISGHGSKGLIQVLARGQTFSANVSVTTHGSQQAVDIHAQSSDLSNISITLHRTH
jgi:hypothetical protein